MSGTAEGVHAKIHGMADRARGAAPSSLGGAVSGASSSLSRAREAAAANRRRTVLAFALLGLTLYARWRWNRA